MKLEISLAPSGGFLLHLPTGRTLELGLNLGGLANLRQLLQDAHDHQETGKVRRGYIGAFPTQSVLDGWLKEDAERKQREAEEKRKEMEVELGFSLSGLDISI